MFLTVRNDGFEETDVLRRCLNQLRSRLPLSWVIDSQNMSSGKFDALVTIAPPTGRRLTLLVEIRPSDRALPPALVHQIRSLAAWEGCIPAVFAEYLPPSTRKMLETNGVAGVDATGWVQVVSDDPPVVITHPGARRAPKVRDETIERLSGPSTSRVLRYLLTARLPLGVREIASECRVSPGTVAKLLPTLEREGIVDRSAMGQVVAIQRTELVNRWSQDYSFMETNKVVLPLIDPRGIDHAQKSLSRIEHLITGVHAGQALLPPSITAVVPGMRLMAYVEDPQEAADSLRFRTASRAQANVILARPNDPQLLREGWHSEKLGIDVAPVGQILVDLKSSPGREADLADQIMNIFDTDQLTTSQWDQRRDSMQ